MKHIEKKIRQIESRGISVIQFGNGWTLQRGQRHMQVADLDAIQQSDLTYLEGHNNTRASENRFRDLAKVG